MKKFISIITILFLTLGTLNISSSMANRNTDNNSLKVQMYNNLECFSNEVVVEFNEEFDIEKCESYKDYKIKDKIISLNAALLELKKPDSLKNVIEELSKDPLVKSVEPNYVFKISYIPNDPDFDMQWGLKSIKCPEAWDTDTGSKSVTVAVVDTGIDYTHPDLAANCVPGASFVLNNDDPLDDNGHGTHCAGIIGAVMNNGKGITGVANVSLMPVKVMSAKGAGNLFSVASGIIYAADNEADVISLSLGVPADISVLSSAVDEAVDNDCFIVAAAGNENVSTKFYPAAYAEVISVAAIDSENNKAFFSNFGDWIDVAAPGVDIFSTMPTYPCELTKEEYGFNQSYDSLSGTSMACPHVAGVAALAKSMHPDWDRTRIRNEIELRADDLGNKSHFGQGRVDATLKTDDNETLFYVNVTIDEISKLDNLDWDEPIDDGKPEWFYEITVKSVSNEYYKFNYDTYSELVSFDNLSFYKPVFNSRNTWNVDKTHSFLVDETEVEIKIKVLEYDETIIDIPGISIPGFTHHDVADISDKENPMGDGPFWNSEGRVFSVTYDLLNDKIINESSDGYRKNDEYYVTQGDDDGSTDEESFPNSYKQDDAKLQFKLSSSYLPPVADAGGPYYINLGESVDFKGNVSHGIAPYTWEWDFGDGITASEQNPVHTYNQLDNYTATLKVTDHFGFSSTNQTMVYIQNIAPEKPVISGPTEFGKNKEQTYTFSISDTNGDDMLIYVDWGDDQIENWIGPYQSGDVNLTHEWSEKGPYTIRAKTRDVHGLESEEVTYDITVKLSKNKFANPLIYEILKGLEEKTLFVKFLQQLLQILS